MVAIEINRLSYRYPDGRRALEEITLQVEAGQCLGLVGPNGAGKSTLLLHLNGLLPAGSGTVRILGRTVEKAHLAWIRQKVGMIFQNPDDQLFCPTIFEDVAFGPLNSQVPSEEVSRRVKLALGKVGLAGFEQRSPHHLSLGEKRKASMATILSMEPEIIALDEPSSNLDPRSRKELIQLLASLPQTRIIATHDLELVMELCDRVVVIDRGLVAASGRPEGILADEALLKAHGLELPEAFRFLPKEKLPEFIVRLRKGRGNSSKQKSGDKRY